MVSRLQTPESLGGDAIPVTADIHRMAPEQHIGACANTLMQQDGDDAWLHASRRSDALLEAGDVDGNAMFKAILSRIKELEKMEPTSAVQ